MNEVKIKDENNFIKDLDSSAILNSNVEALKSYRLKKKTREQEKDKIKMLENKIKELEMMIEKLA